MKKVINALGYLFAFCLAFEVLYASINMDGWMRSEERYAKKKLKAVKDYFDRKKEEEAAE